MFSLVDAVLLRALPYAHPGRLVVLFETNPQRKSGLQGVAPVRVEEWNAISRSFTAISGVESQNITETSGTMPEKLVAADASPRFFSLLNVTPLLGRTFTPEEERYGGPNAALISAQLWSRRFGRSRDVLGKALRLRGELCPIVGVMPASFRMPMTNDEVDVWIPSGYPPALMKNREDRFYLAIGRLRDGVTPAAAQSELTAVQARLARQYPATDLHWQPVLQPLKTATVGRSRKGLWILFGAVLLVLMIGCANVACLFLAQAQTRVREISIRFSLGARRMQIIRQLLIEALLVALAGAAFGLLLSGWLIALLRSVAVQQLPRAEEIQLNWPVALFTLSLGALTTFVFGLAPAWITSRGGNEMGVVRQTGRGQIGAHQPLLRVLVAGQIALAVMLLIGAGLFLRTMVSLMDVPLGFQTSHVLTFHISAAWGETRDYKGVQHRLERTLRALETIPGVESAAITLNMPGASGSDYNLEFKVIGRESSGPGEKLLANAPVVSASYFQILGIPLISGEMCRDNIDGAGGQQGMVNRQFADRFFPGENPVGHLLLANATGGSGPTRILGVVGDVRDTNRTEAPTPTAYWCTAPGFFPDPIYLVKTRTAPAALASAIRKKIGQIEPARAVYEMAPLDTQIALSMGERKMQTILLGMFGLTALLLASVGLYGISAFFVSQRTREIGLRMALGARPGQIGLQLLGYSAAMTLTGIGVGLLTGAALTKFVASLLYGVQSWDPVTFLTTPAILFLVAALASWAPARRAMSIDPAIALRDD